jgi:sugar diacid utilization regulator
MLRMQTLISALVPKTATLLAGEHGHEKVVNGLRIINDPKLVIDCCKNDLVFITSEVLERKDVENTLMALPLGKVAGIILDLSSCAKPLPATWLRQCEKWETPVLSMAWNGNLHNLESFLFQQLMQTTSQEDETKYQQYLLEQVLHQKALPYTADYAELFHIEPDDAFYVAVIELMHGTKAEFAKLDSLCQQKLPIFLTHRTLRHGQDQVVLLFKASEKYTVYDYQVMIKGLLDEHGYQYRVGLNQSCATLSQISVIYEEASITNFIGMELAYPQPFVLISQEIPVAKLIMGIGKRNSKLLEDYVHDTLYKLQDFDAQNGADALEFLKIWLTFSGNTQKIADSLYLHRNTVIYRINKIKNILGYKELTYPVIANLCFAYLVRRALRLEEHLDH